MTFWIVDTNTSRCAIMASNKFQIVVQGEASETDSDDEVYITSAPPVHASSSGMKVAGEASETDSEDEEERVRRLAFESQQQMLRKDLPPLIVIRNTPATVCGQEDRSSPVSRPDSGRFNSLLQQKLLESNARLCTDINQSLKQVYQNAARDIRQATIHLNNSQTGIINASHSIRLILEDLKSVSEKIDIITSCHLLPDITMPNPVSGQS
ncbi:biogenesis of lysosome-related organelles complex 1 subunit 3 [Pimephales promelas]|uniref:biogenesis of lysosome-related organelles complex 1 subunit 3 n=1 Tax=Pimephales promelas TaxID=90988 RepID=UPI001955C596|nr:biogenesis of lysosome-related organelles complex 1 subunit 3 [Pimephales promelas]KAG1952216.1 biogenesis of lysosome-related organelles complex 1 subunit [Pimephales promelas]